MKHTTPIVCTVAFALRLSVIVFVLTHLGPQWFFHRGTEMGFLAQSLLAGHGLSSPFGVPTGPTAIFAPAYPLLVAAVFALTGSYTATSAAILMTLNALFNTATVALILHLARKLAPEPAAILAALIAACAPPLLWMPTIFWETSLSAFLFPACVALGVSLRPSNSYFRWLATGAIYALAALVNPALLPTLFALAALAAALSASRFELRTKNSPTQNSRFVSHTSPQTSSPTSPTTTLLKPTLTAITFLLVFALWPIRNASVFYAFIPTRTNAGYELWMGNRPGASGFYEESLFPTFNSKELNRYKSLGEVAYMQQKSSLARATIHAHPLPCLRLTAVRIVRFWSGSGTRKGPIAYTLYATLTSLLATLGLFSLPRSTLRNCLGIPMLLFPLPYYFTHAEFRYRLVLDPILCILAAVPLARVLATLRAALPAASVPICDDSQPIPSPP